MGTPLGTRLAHTQSGAHDAAGLAVLLDLPHGRLSDKGASPSVQMWLGVPPGRGDTSVTNAICHGRRCARAR